MNRRRFLGSALALAAAPGRHALAAHARQTLPLAYADMHTHIGGRFTFVNVREAMTKNGVLIIARKIIADMPVSRRGIDPGGVARGEFARYFDETLEHMRREHRQSQLTEIDSAQALERVLKERDPAIALASEGGDFLEGDLKRLEAARRLGLVHLQLVHYRISEVGDVANQAPRHQGLSAFGKEVVMACNRLGMLIDVAHGSSDVIAQTLDLSTRPIVYSHGHVTAQAPHYLQERLRARAIHRPLAESIARAGGVIGVWPIGSMFRSIEAYVGALIDTVEALGPAHVGIGTDMGGLPSTVVPGYEQFAVIAGELARRGARAEDINNILGGNYIRVLRQALAV